MVVLVLERRRGRDTAGVTDEVSDERRENNGSDDSAKYSEN